MSDKRFQISGAVMSSEVETSVVEQISPLPLVGRNEVSYGAPLLGDWSKLPSKAEYPSICEALGNAQNNYSPVTFSLFTHYQLKTINLKTINSQL